jgi:hypothetical protein
MTPRVVVEAAADPGPDEKVRLVARMLLGMYRMTEIELGRRLSLPRTSIYNRMQGRTPFTVAEVVRMGEIFRIAPEAFLAGPQALLRSLSSEATRPKVTASPGVSVLSGVSDLSSGSVRNHPVEHFLAVAA